MGLCGVGVPKFRELEPHHACTVGQNGAECPTVPKIGGGSHLLNRETRFSAEIWCKKNQKR
jgi:hypothetical protein